MELAGKRRVLTLGDQALSSVSNLLAVALLARVLAPADFGRFVLGYATLTLTLGLSRAFFGTRVSLAPDAGSARAAAGGSLAVLLLASPGMALLVFGISAAATSGRSLGLLAVVAVATPVVCLQDVLRFSAAASDRPVAAVLSDGAWVAVMAVPLLLHLPLSPSWSLLLWLAGALVALAVAAATTGVRPDLQGGLADLRRRDRVGESVTYGTAVTSLATLGVLFVAAGALGPAAAGSLRGAATAFGPINVLLAFLAIGLTPALARRARGGDVAYCVRVALAVAGCALLWGTVLLLVPDGVGRAAFGRSWTGIHRVLPFTTAEYALLALANAAVLGLKVRRRAGDIVRQRTTAAVVTLLAGCAAALLLHRVTDVAGALVGAAAVSVLAGWSQLVRSDGRPQPDEQDSQSEATSRRPVPSQVGSRTGSQP